MHRPTIALLALLLLAGGVYLSLVDYQGGLATGLNSACWRIGGLLVAVWIAHPQLVRLPAWLYLLLLVLAALIAVRPKLAIIVIPLVIAALWLRPRRGSGSAKNRRTEAH